MMPLWHRMTGVFPEGFRRGRDEGQPYPGGRAFTLMELVLGSLLFGMVAVSLYGVFSQGLRVEQRLRHSMAASQERVLAAETMVQDLQRLAPYRMPGTKRAFFEGAPASIAFVMADGEGLKEVRYEALEPEEERIHETFVNVPSEDRPGVITVDSQERVERALHLVRKRLPFPDARDEDGEKRVLSRNMRSGGLVLAYFGLDDSGSGFWKDRWDRDEWPAVIRIDLSFLDQENRVSRIVRDVIVPFGGRAMGEPHARE